MGAEEKVRSSGELSRQDPEPILPTVNPAVEKSEPAKAGLHPAVYVMYVYSDKATGRKETWGAQS